jgi:uncharacterized protein
MNEETQLVVVPHDSLSAEALTNVINDFISREGTDYGAHEQSAEQKFESVRRQLQKGTALIVFDPQSESVALIRAEDLRVT